MPALYTATATAAHIQLAAGPPIIKTSVLSKVESRLSAPADDTGKRKGVLTKSAIVHFPPFSSGAAINSRRTVPELFFVIV